MTTLLLACTILGAASLAQLVVVPLVASARGHSGALWFMVTALWLLIFGVGALLVGPAWAGTVIALGGETTFSRGTAAYGAACAVIAWLPSFAVALTQRRARPGVRKGTRAGRRLAIGRGRNFSHSARE